MLWNVRTYGKKGATARCFEIDQEIDAILLIIGIVYGVCLIVIKSVQQCTYFLFSLNLLLVGVNYGQRTMQKWYDKLFNVKYLPLFHHFKAIYQFPKHIIVLVKIVTEYGTVLTTILPILFLYLNTVIVTAGAFEP